MSPALHLQHKVHGYLARLQEHLIVLHLLFPDRAVASDQRDFQFNSIQFNFLFQLRKYLHD